MNTSKQATTAGQGAVKHDAFLVFYAIKNRRPWPRTFCHVCRQKMDHGDREYAVFEGETGVLCHACAAKHAPELAKALEHMYAPRHISGTDLGGLPIDVVWTQPQVTIALQSATQLVRQAAGGNVFPPVLSGTLGEPELTLARQQAPADLETEPMDLPERSDQMQLTCPHRIRIKYTAIAAPNTARTKERTTPSEKWLA